MKYVWDENKNRLNRIKHGIDFKSAEGFNWDFAVGAEIQVVDGEERELWLGPIGYEIFALLITERETDFRVISIRRATNFEKTKWRNEYQR